MVLIANPLIQHERRSIQTSGFQPIRHQLILTMKQFEIKESDWKIVRRLHKVALERFCKRGVEQIRAAVSSRDGDDYERFIKIYKLVNKRDREIARIFNNPRRSQAIFILTSLMEEHLLTDDVFSQLSPETRAAVELIMGFGNA